MRKFLLPGMLAMLLSLGAFAQDRGGEAYFGYSFFSAGKNGWNGDLGYNLSRNVQVLGDFGGYYSHNNSIHSYMGGVKVEAGRHRGGFQPWGRFLLGGSHVSRLHEASDSAWSWAVGGGLDSSLSHKAGLRLSAEGVHTDFNSNGDFHLRAGVGLFYRF